jgi:hypothetical protein
MLVALPCLSQTQAAPGAEVGKSPIPNNCEPASRASLCGAVKKLRPMLLGPRAATLDQDNQNDDNQHTCNNPDDCGTVHSNSSFPH